MVYVLLTAANLSNDHERLVRATASLEFNEMKNKLERAFGKYDGREGDKHVGTLPIKEECLYTKGYTHRGHKHHGFNQGLKHQMSTTNHKGFNWNLGGIFWGKGSGNPVDSEAMSVTARVAVCVHLYVCVYVHMHRIYPITLNIIFHGYIC